MFGGKDMDYTFEILLTLLIVEALLALALYIEHRVHDIIVRKKMQLAELLMRTEDDY